MAHPRMYGDDDPFLAKLREVCLGLPESVEVEAWGRPTFRAGGAAGAGGGPPLLRAGIFRAERVAGARLYGGAGRLGRGDRADGELLPPGGAATDAEGPRRTRLIRSGRHQRPARRSTTGPAASMLALDTT